MKQLCCLGFSCFLCFCHASCISGVNFFILHFLIQCMCLYAGVCMHMPQHVCGGQRITCRSWFAPSTKWVPGVQPRSSIMETGTFILWAILLTQDKLFLKKKYNPYSVPGNMCNILEWLGSSRVEVSFSSISLFVVSGWSPVLPHREHCLQNNCSQRVGTLWK